jgi:ribosome biogenesis GTPase A
MSSLWLSASCALRVDQLREKGVRKTVRAMVVGIPNVGKSTFINNLRGRASAKASDRPGVTRGKQWIVISEYLEFLDTPGMLWPKLEDKEAAKKLAYLGSVRDEILDAQGLACAFLSDLAVLAPEAIMQRFKINELSHDGYVLFEQACRGRGWILSGGRIDEDRALPPSLMNSERESWEDFPWREHVRSEAERAGTLI